MIIALVQLLYRPLFNSNKDNLTAISRERERERESERERERER